MSVVIIGCGGFGIKRLGDLHKAIDSLGNVTLLGIDGSASDLEAANLPNDLVHLVEGKDGAGKIRAANAKEYCEWVDSNLSVIPKATLYIIMYSTSGGSGNVLGTHIAMQLTARGENVVNVGVITGRSGIDAKNTVNTLNGLGAYVNKLNKPLFISIMEQGDMPASTVDAATLANVMEFSRIAAFKYSGLDTSDIRSFFNYPAHGIAPQLTEIVHYGNDTLDDMVSNMCNRTLTQLSIINSQDGTIPPLMALYDCHGIDVNSDLDNTVHYATSTQSMKALQKTITERLESYIEANKALNSTAVFGDGASEMVY